MTDETGLLETPSTDQLTGMTPPQRSEWLRTGKIPEAKPEAPPPSPAPARTEPAETKPAAAASEPATPPETIETRRAKTERRFKELLDDRKAKDALIAGLQERLAKLEGKGAEVKPAPAAESPKPAEKSKLQEKIAAINAKDSEYKTYEEKIVAIAEAVADDRAERLKEEQAAAVKEAETTKTQKEHLDRWKASCAEAAKLHKDFAEVTKPLGDAAVIPPGSIVEATILMSEAGTEIFYYLGQHRDELDAILKMNPLAQARALFKIEAPFLVQSPPVKDKTEAPPPPRELGSGATAPKDELEAAVKAGDTGRYIREANARDIAKAKSRRG